MKIVFLLETASDLWGGVKIVLEDANGLTDRGHDVTVLARSGPPDWMRLRCGFTTVPDFAPERVPEADVVVGTFWTTVPAAIAAGKGPAAHYCQGYEGDNPENRARREEIEAVYRDERARKITVSPHLTRLIQERFGQQALEIRNGIDRDTMYPTAPPAALASVPSKPVRVGLVGPYEVVWKDLSTGLEACRLAHAAGLDLRLVRITNTEPHPSERDLPFPVEWYQRVPPAQMGDLYRTMHVFLGTSRGHEEGFFLPAVEAMACGVPCVLTDVPCFRDYGDGQHALFVEPGNPTEMAEALIVVAGHPRVRAQLVREGLATAARFDRGLHLEELERALESIAGHPSDRLDTAPAPVVPPAPRPASVAGELAEVTRGMVQTLQQTARAYLETGDAEAALRHVEAALLLAPEDAALLNDLGVLRYSTGNAEGAREAFERAVDLDPTCEDARANLQDLAAVRS